MSQHVIRGRNSLNGANIAALLEALSVQKPLVVCGARMTEVFRSRTGMDWPVFSGYHPNPDLADSEAGAVETYGSFASKCGDAKVHDAFMAIVREESEHLTVLLNRLEKMEQ